MELFKSSSKIPGPYSQTDVFKLVTSYGVSVPWVQFLSNYKIIVPVSQLWEPEKILVNETQMEICQQRF